MNRLVDLSRSGSQLFFGKIKKSKWKSERERKECRFRTWSKGNDVNGLSISKVIETSVHCSTVGDVLYRAS